MGDDSFLIPPICAVSGIIRTVRGELVAPLLLPSPNVLVIFGSRGAALAISEIEMVAKIVNFQPVGILKDTHLCLVADRGFNFGLGIPDVFDPFIV